jgi:hypothetical protein
LNRGDAVTRVSACIVMPRLKFTHSLIPCGKEYHGPIRWLKGGAGLL